MPANLPTCKPANNGPYICVHRVVVVLLNYDFEIKFLFFILPRSCFKYDGYALDNKRIVVRDCGFFHADECVSNYPYDGDANVVGCVFQ